MAAEDTADTAVFTEAPDTADLVAAIAQAVAGQRQLDSLREVLQRSAGRDLAAETEAELLQQVPETPRHGDAHWNLQQAPKVKQEYDDAPWNLPKTSPTHVDEGWEAESWKEESWKLGGSWEDESWKEESLELGGSWKDESCEEACGPLPEEPSWEASSSSAAAPPAVAKAKAKHNELGAWYATKDSFEGNGRAVDGQSYRPRPLGGDTGDKPPRWGNRGGKKAQYFSGWHAAKKRGPEALAAYEAEHRK
jgi:hypothetical protein